MIGCGGIAPTHANVYLRLKDVEVAGLCDLNLDRAKKMATEFKVEHAYADYHEMFDKEKPDLVDICTPVSTHSKIVCDAAEAVPAILVEKPMALNVAQCDEIIKKVEKHGRKLCIGHNQLFSPNIQRARRMVDSEGFDLYSFRTTLRGSFAKLKSLDLMPAWNVFPEQRGIIWEVCCHHAYLHLNFLPDIKEVYAVGGKVKYPVYDDFAVLLRTNRSSYGLIEISWVTKEMDVTYEFRDKNERRLQIDWEHDYMFELSQEPPLSMRVNPHAVGIVTRDMLSDQKRLWKKWIKFGTAYIHKHRLVPTFNLISSYIDAIKNDQPPPVSPHDGRRTIRLLETIEESLDKKTSVNLSA